MQFRHADVLCMTNRSRGCHQFRADTGGWQVSPTMIATTLECSPLILSFTSQIGGSPDVRATLRASPLVVCRGSLGRLIDLVRGYWGESEFCRDRVDPLLRGGE